MTFRWKAADLDEQGLRATIPSSTMTLGGLLKHLALVEDLYFRRKILDEPMPEPWASVDWDSVGEGWDWASAADESAADLYSLYDAATERSRASVAQILAQGGLDAPSNTALPDGSRANVRRVLMDVIEEYGRHTGHADILREAVDGRVGEDPPY